MTWRPCDSADAREQRERRIDPRTEAQLDLEGDQDGAIAPPPAQPAEVSKAKIRALFAHLDPDSPDAA